MYTRPTRRRLTLGLITFLLLASAVFPQSQISSSDLKGKISDTQGGVLPGATVTITSAGKGVSRTLVTDERGEYSFPLLQPGVYDLKVEFPGFMSQLKKGFQLTVGQTGILDVVMPVAGTGTEIVVTTEAPLIETERTQQSAVIEERRITNLPINQRDFLDFAKLTPGISTENPYNTAGLPQLSTSNFSSSGQSSRGNSVNIDGASNNSFAGNSVRGTISQEAVQEFQVNRSNFSAEFGEASAAVINIVTKSGANKFHGNLFYFLRDQKLDARNAFAFGPGGTSFDPPFSRQQWGATFGGPLRKNKSFFFTSFERLDRAEAQFSTYLNDTSILGATPKQGELLALLASRPQTAPLATQLRNTLVTTPFADSPCGPNVNRANFPFTMSLLCRDTGVLPYKANSNAFSTRLDHNFNQSHQVNGRLNYTQNFIGAFQVAPNRARSNGANNTTRDAGFTVTDNYIFNPNLVNEGRFQFAARRLKSIPVTSEGPVFSLGGVGEFGRNNNIPSIYTERRLQFVDNLTVTHGNHRLKTGFDFNRFHFDSETKIFFGGSTTFADGLPLFSLLPSGGPGVPGSLENLLSQGVPFALLSQPLTSLQTFNVGLPVLYQQGFGNPGIVITAWTFAGYVNDNWKVSKNLSLDFGLRYSLELQPPPIHRDKNNFGPRFGFSWDPWNNGKTVVRGGYGVYYSPLFQAITFISKVLARDTGISQVFVPITGIPVQGRTVTSAEIFRTLRAQGVIGTRTINEQDLLQFGIVPGPRDPNRIIFAVDPKIVNPYNQQVSFGIEREIVQNFGVSVNYIMSRGVKLLWLVDTNVKQVGLNPRFGTPIFNTLDPRNRVDPTALQINTAESSGSSIYHGMTVEVNKRYSRHMQILVAYTMGKSISDATDIFTEFEPNNQTNKRAERGIALFDQRQRLVVSGVLESPLKAGAGNHILSRMFADVTISPIFAIESGRPFNLELAGDPNGDTHTTDRPFFPNPNGPAAFAGKNTGLGPRFTNFDMSVSKRLRLRADNPISFEMIFQAFNLFNSVNYTGINNTVLMDLETGRPLLSRGVTRDQDVPMSTFRVRGIRGAPSTSPLGFNQAAPARQLQLGLKFNF
ncbi:MAG: TonB-dependent receptor [Acidobacteria bacterium]|nr:TonB-dependent receptor [Acidobacteriota bacterium]MBI3654904.1 TonB-dependent receptor [Acidobacteriota bacterium]